MKRDDADTMMTAARAADGMYTKISAMRQAANKITPAVTQADSCVAAFAWKLTADRDIPAVTGNAPYENALPILENPRATISLILL